MSCRLGQSEQSPRRLGGAECKFPLWALTSALSVNSTRTERHQRICFRSGVKRQRNCSFNKLSAMSIKPWDMQFIWTPEDALRVADWIWDRRIWSKREGATLWPIEIGTRQQQMEPILWFCLSLHAARFRNNYWRTSPSLSISYILWVCHSIFEDPQTRSLSSQTLRYRRTASPFSNRLLFTISRCYKDSKLFGRRSSVHHSLFGEGKIDWSIYDSVNSD